MSSLLGKSLFKKLTILNKLSLLVLHRVKLLQVCDPGSSAITIIDVTFIKANDILQTSKPNSDKAFQ